MAPNRSYRVLIFEDSNVIRKILWEYFDSLNYEVFTFPHPKSCALCDFRSCNCSTHEACADVIIADLNMPFVKGLDFIEQQIKKGCKVNAYALMSGDLTGVNPERAKKLGIELFQKPFDISELSEWVKKAEKQIPDDRLLSNWAFFDNRLLSNSAPHGETGIRN